MGKASRLKAQRVKTPPPVGKHRAAVPRRLVWLATSGFVALVAVVVVVVLVTRSSSSSPQPAAASASDKNAPAALVKAANAVNFHPNVEAGVGQIEGLPASAAGPPSNPNLLAVGTKAPGFTLKTPQGDSVSLSDFRGKAVLLEFFATWCPHCDAEAPHLKKLFGSLPKAKYAWVGVNADGENAASVYAYHRYFGLSSPSLLDPSSQPGSFTQPGAAGPVTTQYQVQAFPTFYVLDRQGKITWRSDGEQPDALLRQELVAAAKK